MRKVPRFELVNWVVENVATAKYRLGMSEVIGDDETLAMMDWDDVVEVRSPRVLTRQRCCAMRSTGEGSTNSRSVRCRCTTYS